MKTEKVKVLARIFLVFLLSIIIWRLALLIFGSHMMLDHLLWHMSSGFFISFLVSMLMIAVINTDSNTKHISWKQPFQKHLKNLVLGFLYWIVPAGITILLLSLTGQIVITFHGEPMTIIRTFLMLIIAVFLVEALPEELIRDYQYSRLKSIMSPWSAVIGQTLLFTLFAYFIGSLDSIDQWLFIPGFGFLLGYFRMVSDDIWFSMGFHLSLMTITQLISPIRQLIEVDGSFIAIRFLSFILIPAIVSSVFLDFRSRRSKT